MVPWHLVAGFAPGFQTSVRCSGSRLAGLCNYCRPQTTPLPKRHGPKTVKRHSLLPPKTGALFLTIPWPQPLFRQRAGLGVAFWRPILNLVVRFSLRHRILGCGVMDVSGREYTCCGLSRRFCLHMGFGFWAILSRPKKASGANAFLRTGHTHSPTDDRAAGARAFPCAVRVCVRCAVPPGMPLGVRCFCRANSTAAPFWA